MSLECTSNPVYRTSIEQKLHSKNAAKAYRFGSPKIRDQLRQKCRMRVREARQASFSRRRLADIAEEIDINKLMREELAGIESDLRLQEEIYRELRDEMNEWFVQELEAEETYLINEAEDNGGVNSVICPICQQSTLTCAVENQQQSGRNTFSCDCGASFNFSADLLELRKVLSSKISAHEQNCGVNLTFFLEPESVRSVMAQTNAGGQNTLSVLCNKCDYFYGF